MKSSFLWGFCCLCSISLAIKTANYRKVDIPFGYFEVLKTYKEKWSVVPCAALCRIYPQSPKKCNGFQLVKKDCKLLAANWTNNPGSVPRVDVYVDSNLKVAGSDYKVISEDIFDDRFHGRYMLDDLLLDECYDSKAYWQGPEKKTPVSVKFDTILPINVRKIRMRNNHEKGQNYGVRDYEITIAPDESSPGKVLVNGSFANLRHLKCNIDEVVHEFEPKSGRIFTFTAKSAWGTASLQYLFLIE